MSNPTANPSATGAPEAKPPVVLNYVGHLSPHGVLLISGVPARDLTQADIDELPLFKPAHDLTTLTPEGELLAEPMRRMSIADLLAFDPPVYARAVVQPAANPARSKDKRAATQFDEPGKPPAGE